MLIPLNHYLIFSAALFTIGIFGALTRRNVIGILISIELILNASTVNLIAFSKSTAIRPESAQMFAFFVIALAAAAAVVGLALVLALFRIRKTILTEEIHLLKW